MTDGVVMSVDVRLPHDLRVITSDATAGKHLLPVSQVRWVPTEVGQPLCFYSVSADGRVSEWGVLSTSLYHTDILDFHYRPYRTKHSTTSLHGTATCIAFNPQDKSVMVVGVDTGSVLQVNTASTVHALTHYHAHTGPVRAVAWNTYHHKVFATCSLDWSLKVWLQYHTSPLVSLDLGAPVAGLAWSYFSSSVIVGVTDEGRVYVYDLFVRKCRPLCVQNILQRRRSALSCVAFSPFYPVILVGGERGYLLTLKLSPNLRRNHKTRDELSPREAEVCKMERIIATTRSKLK
nr:dynein intermediate chain 2, ciliary-like [Cherax quadricarinatus]